MSKYNQDQIKYFGTKRLKEFVNKKEQSRENLTFYEMMDSLFVKIYQLNEKNQYLSKMGALEFIPTTNNSICYRSINRAVKEGYIKLEKMGNDKRMIFLVQTEKMKKHVEYLLEEDADNARTGVAKIFENGDMPFDNNPLSGVKTEQFERACAKH